MQNKVNKETKRSLLDYAVISLKGMAMGAVEFLPGISGGTIAFVVGIYQELLNTIKGALPAFKQLFGKKSFKQRITDFWTALNGNFIVALILGVFIAIAATAGVVKYMLEHYTIPFYAFVFGLVLASVVLVYKKVAKWTWICYLLGLLGIGLSLLMPIQAHDSATIVPLPYLFFCACLASCAFILPGISGTFVMLLMGAYFTIVNAVNTLDIIYLAVFIAGCLTGLISFSNFLSWLLKKYYDFTVALMTGFIIGSLRIIYPWKTEVAGTIENIRPDGMISEALFACLGGIVVIFGIEFAAKKISQRVKKVEKT
jgi:putative membrane protein